MDTITKVTAAEEAMIAEVTEGPPSGADPLFVTWFEGVDDDDDVLGGLTMYVSLIFREKVA